MPQTRTATDLRLESRRAANLEGDRLFVTDDEALRYLNTGLQTLYDRLVAAYGDDYFETTKAFTVTGTTGTTSTALPADFYKFLGLDYLVTSSQRICCLPYRRLDRNYYQTYPAVTWYGPQPMYRLRAGYLDLIGQLASSTMSMELFYVPTMPQMQIKTFEPAAVSTSADTITLAAHGLRANQAVRLTPTSTGAVPSGTRSDTDYYVSVTDADTIQLLDAPDGTAVDLTDTGSGTITLDTVFDGINGWERFAVLTAARIMLSKGEEDTSGVDTELALLDARLTKMVEDRDASMPHRVQDVDSLKYQQRVRWL